MPLLQVQSVSRTFHRGNQVVDALVDCTMDVEQGECVVGQGPSGSGKTTLLMAMGGLQRPTAGSILFDGRAIWDGSEADRAAYRLTPVGFVFQDPHLLPWLNARDNIAMAAHGQASMEEIELYLPYRRLFLQAIVPVTFQNVAVPTGKVQNLSYAIIVLDCLLSKCCRGPRQDAKIEVRADHFQVRELIFVTRPC